MRSHATRGHPGIDRGPGPRGGFLSDLDGVLVDSLASVERAWTWWASSHGLDPGPFVNSHGRPTAEKIAELAPGLDVEAEAAAVEEHETRDTDGLVALPGAVELFDFEPPVAVVTSGTRSLATARLTAVGLPIPDVLITADVVANGKPHPEPYLLAAARLDLVPSDCVVLEDAPAGVEAGKAAGMWVVAVTTTFPASELGGADQVVPDVAAYLVSLGAGE